MANSLKEAKHYEEIVDRLTHLSEHNQRKWGKMNVDQMLDHLTKSFDAANGDLAVPKEPISFLLSIGVLKKVFIRSIPWPKNLMTAKAYTSVDTEPFELSKAKLLKSMEKFIQLKNHGDHPLFDKMDELLWGQLQYKHCDHHLSQFGA